MTKKNKIVISLVLNSVMALFSFIILMKSLDKGELWRIIFAGLGFLVFLIFLIMILNEFIKHKKSVE